MPYEQNVDALPCAIVVLQAESNEMADIAPLIPRLLERLQRFTPRSVIRVS